ncbi:MAG: radical SAM protein [Bacillota bacterium]
MYASIIRNMAACYLRGDRFVTHPVLVSLYVTHRCNLRCTYCSDGCSNPFYLDSREELPVKDIRKVLEKIVRTTRYLDITGGEPLLRDDIIEIITCARQCGFKGIFLNTNGLLLDRFPGIIDKVDMLSVSLDSLYPERLKNFYRTDINNVNTILNNIKCISKDNNKKKFFLSSVIMPDNINDVIEVAEFCMNHKIGFTASPQLKGILAAEELFDSDKYRTCIDYIISRKKKGLRVLGSVEYYKTIRDFRSYKCFPLLHTAIDPSGKLYLPCLELKGKMVNLMEFESLGDAIVSRFNGAPHQPDCGNVCHILCHAGLSLLIKNMSVSLSELYYDLRDKVLN